MGCSGFLAAENTVMSLKYPTNIVRKKPSEKAYHGPITDAERAWVARALRQRRWLVRMRVILFCATAGFVSLLFPGMLWVSVVIEDTPQVGPQIPTWFTLGIYCFSAFIFALIWRMHRNWLTKLPEIMKGSIPSDLRAQAEDGIIYVNHDDEKVAILNTFGEGPFGPIQVPPHWMKLFGSNEGALKLRIAKVDASGKDVVTKSVIRGGMTSSGAAIGHPVTYATYADPVWVLLGIGGLSVDAEVKGGVGFPPFRSGAGILLAVYLSVAAVFVAFFTWVTSEYSNKLADAAPVIFILCTLVHLTWIIPLVRFIQYERRAVRFYVSGFDDTAQS